MSAVTYVTLDDSLHSPLWASASLPAMWEDRTGTFIGFLYLVTMRSWEDRRGNFLSPAVASKSGTTWLLVTCSHPNFPLELKYPVDETVC